jgi:ribonuclease T1
MALCSRGFWRALFFALSLSLVLLVPTAGGAASAESGEIQAVALSELPPQAAHTLRLIREGGPFPHARDGVVFRNFERLLPLRERGYYREYTVATPGLTHRGARRIVAGRGGELYYTDDHYRSFKRIRE